LDHVASLPQAKLLHGVGHPFGGTAKDPIDPLPLLRNISARLDPVWVSEHLSFNRVQRGAGVEHVGFLLPPPQSPAAVRLASQNISKLCEALDRPIAFETGVNYLRLSDREMHDGDFFSAIAKTSNSGILLDLHNLWCNERNGRQRVRDVIARLTLEHVWEIHFAGGLEESGYWVDAHSGAVPPEVLEIAADLIPRLPHLGALIFEILPQYLPQFDLNDVQRQIEKLHQFRTLRSPMRMHTRLTPRSNNVNVTSKDVREIADREHALVSSLRARSNSSELRGLFADPGLGLLRRLITDFREASLARALRYTVTAMLSGLGSQMTHNLFDAYFEANAPEPFAAVEADQFANFLRVRLARLSYIPFFDEVLSYEHALLRAVMYGLATDIRWSADPVLILESLDAGQLPGKLPAVSNTMRICAA
jgi:uncharacterized protein